MAEAGLEESLWRVVNELVLCGLQPACWILWGFKLHEFEASEPAQAAEPTEATPAPGKRLLEQTPQTLEKQNLNLSSAVNH